MSAEGRAPGPTSTRCCMSDRMLACTWDESSGNGICAVWNGNGVYHRVQWCLQWCAKEPVAMYCTWWVEEKQFQAKHAPWALFVVLRAPAASHDELLCFYLVLFFHACLFLEPVDRKTDHMPFSNGVWAQTTTGCVFMYQLCEGPCSMCCSKYLFLLLFSCSLCILGSELLLRKHVFQVILGSRTV